LDLNDVRNQIEELEIVLKRNRTKDNIETHRKLIEYEEKLKDQYEKMTGISIDQATALAAGKVAVKVKSAFPSILGMIAGLLFGWGFYNAVLQGIEGFGPLDLVNFFQGSNDPVPSSLSLVAGLTYSTSNALIVGPLGASILLILLRGILANNRTKIIELVDALAHLAIAGFFIYLIQIPETNAEVLEGIEDNMFILGLVVLAAGILISLTAIEDNGGFSKAIKVFIGLLILYTAVQIILISNVESADFSSKLLNSWPWFITPLMLAGFLSAFYDLVQYRNIQAENKIFTSSG
jgi:hypothetical protein